MDPPPVGSNPYVGPRPFLAGEPIFGRAAEVRDLYYLLNAERIVLLHSPSGAGKSSLVQAGLIPQLKQGSFDVWPAIRVSSERPAGSTANRYVRSTMLSLEEELPDRLRRDAATLDSLTLAEYVLTRARKKAAAPNVALIFDQFEEILTIEPVNIEAKRAFFTQLGELLRHRQVWALFAIREDYLAPLDPYAQLVPTHLTNRFRLDLLGREAAGEAIDKPAAEGNRVFAPEAVDKLVQDLAMVSVQQVDGSFARQAGRYVEPLQLQVVCRGLWERMPAGDLVIDLEDVERFGDVTDALSAYYSSEVAKIAGGDVAVERAVREWVGQKLITPSGIRGQVLSGVGRSEGLDNRLIGRLVDAHLVRGEQRSNSIWYELAHDRLIDPVTKNNEAWREAHLAPVQKIAAVWEGQGRPDGLLLTDADLVEAQRWAEANDASVTDSERRFLKESGEKQRVMERERHQAKKLAFLLRLSVAALIIVVGVGAFAFVKWRDAEFQRMEAERQKRVADEQKTEAERLKGVAESKSEEARIATDNAVAAAKDAKENEGIAREQERQARVALASTAIEKGAGAENEHRYREALAYFARALRLNPDSVTARAWVTDLLTRATWAIPRAVVKLEGQVLFVAFSPDGRRIVTGSADKTARIGDAGTGAPMGKAMRHDDEVTFAAFSPDGRRVATAAGEKAQIWSVETGDPIGDPIVSKDGFRSMAFSPDGKTLLTTGGHNATLWPSGTSLAHSNDVYSARFIDNGHVITSSGNAINTWDLATQKLTITKGLAAEGSGMATTASFSGDGRYVAVAKADSRAAVFDVQAGYYLGQYRHEHRNYKMKGEDVRRSQAPALSPDGRRLITLADALGLVFESSPSVRKSEQWEWYRVGLDHEDLIYAAGFSTDGRRAVTGSKDKTAVVWDLDRSRLAVAEMPGVYERAPSALLKSGSPVFGATLVTPDGRRLLLSNPKGNAREGFLWDVEAGKRASPPFLYRHNVTAAAFSRDGWRLITGHSDGTAQSWDLRTGKPIAGLLGKPADRREEEIMSVAFSPDSQLAIVTTPHGTAQIWRTATGKPVGQPLEHNRGSRVFEGAFSPDGSLAVTACADGKARLWDSGTGHLAGMMVHTARVRSAAFSPDGKFLLTASEDSTAKIWRVERRTQTGSESVHNLAHPGPLQWARFSQNGTRVLTAAGDNQARVWDAQSGKPVGVPMRDDGAISRYGQFSPDGRLVVVARDSMRPSSAAVWDAGSGKQIGGEFKGVYPASFCLDGRYLVSPFRGGIALWQLEAGKSGDRLAEIGEAVAGISVSDFGSTVEYGRSEWIRRVNALAGPQQPGEIAIDAMLRQIKAASNAR